MKHTLALVMIARNEARCIQRCLDSVRGLVDQMVVLDTGSTDATVSLAQMAGAEVSHFSWVDDFAAARNAALALSRCDWNLVLDADETLLQGPRTAQALLALRACEPDFVGRIAVRSSFDGGANAPSQATSSWLSRVLPRGARFEGVVHEQVAGTWPRRDLELTADHDGYQAAQMQSKGDRNARLLQAALRAQPDDAYLLYQLGKDHEVHDRFEPALEAYVQAWNALPPDAHRDPAWRHDLLLRLLFVLPRCGRVEDAIQLADIEMPHWQDSPDFFFVLGDILLTHATAHPESAADVLPMIEQAWQHCLAIGENPSLEGAVAGRGSHLARHNLGLVQVLISVNEPSLA
jgi:glycosyltransferase involved in cell wall biosynthesis